MKVRKRIMSILSIVFSCMLIALPVMAADEVVTENKIGSHDGYDYEYWRGEGPGEGSMTLKAGGAFSCEWTDANNILFRKGRKFDSTQTHEELGNMQIEYGCNYEPDGNSYLCVYGWTVDPLIEFYVVESWGSWRPPGNETAVKETVTIDGGTYEIYQTKRVNQPSIQGTKTFDQFWSVRTDRRTEGTISVSEHMKAWEKLGMKLGKMYETAFCVEGYQSSGKADLHTNNLVIGDAAGGNDSDTALTDESGSDSADNDEVIADNADDNQNTENETDNDFLMLVLTLTGAGVIVILGVVWLILRNRKAKDAKSGK